MVYPWLEPTVWKSGKPDADLRAPYMARLLKGIAAVNEACSAVCFVRSEPFWS